MAEGAQQLNIPGFQANRGLVSYPDGGLYDPPVLTFDPSMNTLEFFHGDERFHFPTLENIKRPQKDEDVAFMTVSCLAS